MQCGSRCHIIRCLTGKTLRMPLHTDSFHLPVSSHKLTCRPLTPRLSLKSSRAAHRASLHVVAQRLLSPGSSGAASHRALLDSGRRPKQTGRAARRPAVVSVSKSKYTRIQKSRLLPIHAFLFSAIEQM